MNAKEIIEQYGEAPWRFLPKAVDEHVPEGTVLHRPNIGGDYRGKDGTFYLFYSEAIVTDQTITEDGVEKQILKIGAGLFVDTGGWFKKRWHAESEAARLLLERSRAIQAAADRLLAKVANEFREREGKQCSH